MPGVSHSKRIFIATPSPAGPTSGNRVTARRWAAVLRSLGHRVRIGSQWRGEAADILVALHALRSFSSLAAFRRAHPDRPAILALTGTDIYDAGRRGTRLDRALRLATRLVVLQPLARQAIPTWARRRTTVIIQAADRPARAPHPPPAPSSARHKPRERFEVCVLAHLRPVKDPLRAALAARRLPAVSRIRVTLAGRSLDARLTSRARSEARHSTRFRWLGGVPRRRALDLLERSRLMVIASRSEGGPGALSEALAAGVPILASRVDGTRGVLGASYPGLFRAGDTAGLTTLLSRAENDPAFLRRLASWCRRRRRLVDPAREREAWSRLLARLRPG